ncbi:SDR family NAD(P)-dependent oxidoreductase [Microcella daejeonensis]|uniref:Probable oxidoreductase n=1 Tax=Microcella daejeonensis TaxID=2994971 RepID=A0A9E8S7F2_9MICO|nr:SDR family NAD(P)-dependent oxidoreductase [Microcella daejeonensis]WAB80405.1 SDR family NAD(P)-dependent oxidoreductase [Microcella daejeonensis]
MSARAAGADRLVTPFGERTTAVEVLAGVDLSGRAMLVTGGSSGIGRATAQALAAAGARVTITSRSHDDGMLAAASIERATGAAVAVPPLDLADSGSIARLIAGWEGPLDALVLNAGVMAPPLARTPEGWESQFAINHLGHFRLALGLRAALAEAAVERGEARIVSLSSSGHGSSPVLFDDPHFERRPYDAGVAYGQSKTANALFAVEADRRWRAQGIRANAVMPGGAWTRLQRHWPAGRQEAIAAQAAATSVLAAASPLLAGIGGRYLEDCGEAELVTSIADGVHGVLAHALDPVAAEQLWELSVAMLEEHPASPR